MPFIYKISNDINDKVYIGKTLLTIEERWKEHKRDANKRRNEKRPLYSAINKYGEEHFYIEEIEECHTEIIDDREKYWIKYYNSYGKGGYNATEGGDGKPQFNYDEIYQLWQKGKTVTEIELEIGCCQDTIDSALRNYNISSEDRRRRNSRSIAKNLCMLDKNTEEILQEFETIKDAYCFLNKKRSSHIQEVANGTRKQAYGYKWKWK